MSGRFCQEAPVDPLVRQAMVLLEQDNQTGSSAIDDDDPPEPNVADIPAAPLGDSEPPTRDHSLPPVWEDMADSERATEPKPVLTLHEFMNLAPKPSSKDQLVEVSDGVFGELIGEGSAGKVYKVILREGAKPVAVKTSRRGPSREARILAQLSHFNIVEYLGPVYKHSPYIKPFYYDFKLELGISNLKNYLHQTATICLWDALRIFDWLCQGLNYIHKKFVHCDLKPENVLVCKGIIKICDFDAALPPGNYKRVISSPNIIPPEYFMTSDGLITVTPDFDSFSLGLLMYRVINGRSLYDEQTYDPKKAFPLKNWLRLLAEKFKAEGEGPIFTFTQPDLSKLDGCCPELRDKLFYLIQMLLRLEPQYRATPLEIHQIISRDMQRVREGLPVEIPVDIANPVAGSIFHPDVRHYVPPPATKEQIKGRLRHTLFGERVVSRPQASEPSRSVIDTTYLHL